MFRNIIASANNSILKYTAVVYDLGMTQQILKLKVHIDFCLHSQT